MSIKRGNIGISELYLGAYRIGQAYLGSTKIYQAGAHVPSRPYLIFQFTDNSFDPRSVFPVALGLWTRTSNVTANEWYWERDFYSDQGTGSDATGWPATFSSTGATPVGKLTATTLGSGNYCSIVGYGNLTGASTYPLVSMDRMFANCTALTEFVTIQTPNTLENVGGCFMGCTAVEDGALDQYTYWLTNNTNIANHSGTFTDCGANTQTGLAELNQIPTGWGGLYVPANTLMESYRTQWRSRYDTWEIDGNYPTWVSVVPNHMNLFTTSSVSAYTGVSMNRSRIYRRNNLDVSTSAPLYFYPCFMQHSTSDITWAVVTANPNGQLAAGQGNTDMPGTLDYSAIGPFTYEYGTLDSGNVYFCFLATNVPIASWNGMTDPYGVLYNGNFKTDAGLRWFF